MSEWVSEWVGNSVNDCDLVGCHRHLEVFAPPLEQGDQGGEATEHVTIWDGWMGGLVVAMVLVERVAMVLVERVAMVHSCTQALVLMGWAP